MIWMRCWAPVLLGAFGVVHGFSGVPLAAAQASDAAPGAKPSVRGPYELANTSPWFLGGELLGSLAVYAAYGIAAGSPATRCGWCDTNGFDRSLRRVFVIQGASKTAATVSHVFAMGLAPAIAIAGVLVPAFESDRSRFAWEDTVIILNSLVLGTGISQGSKRLGDRQRPGYYYGRANDIEYGPGSDQEFLSFYSGHTAFAFAAVSSSTTLALQRGYWTAPYIAAGGGAFALSTGILRMSADLHWATDMLMGAFVGTAVGALLPFALHPRRGEAHVAILPSLARDHALLMARGVF